MDREIDKAVDAVIDDVIAQKYEKFIYEDETAEDTYCCDLCQGQAAYFVRKGN